MTATAAPARVFGSGIRRREDPRLLTGTARYTADFMLPGMVHAAILRSPHGHARIRGIDTSRAKQAPGVRRRLHRRRHRAALKPIPCAWLLPNAEAQGRARIRAMATDIVRYVGDAVAVVVAETDYQAYDALDLIDVDYEPLPAVVDPQKAAAAGAPQLHAGSRPATWRFTGPSPAATSTPRSRPPTSSCSDRIIQQRLIPTAMEPRGAVAQFTPATGELTLWNTTQNPHIVRFIMSLVTGVPEDRLRVIAPEVGGGFGSKIAQIQGDFITAFCSMKLGRPVKWIETRSRELPGDDPRARSRAGGRAGRDEGRHDPRPALHGVGGHGRVSLDRRAGHPDDPPRADAVGPVQRAGRQGRRVRRLHEHDAGRSLSRRRPARSDVHARAHDRRARAQAAASIRSKSGGAI